MTDTGTTRERLIESARDLVRRRGFDRTSVSDVLEHSGVGKGSFFHYFSSKEGLGLAVLERDRVEFLAMLDESLGWGGSALERLDCFLDAALQLHRGTGFVGGCLWGNTALEMSDSNSVFADVVAKVFDEWTDRVATVIGEGQVSGEMRADCSAATLARSVVATIEGGIMLSRLQKDEAPLKGCLDMARLLLTGETRGGVISEQ